MESTPLTAAELDRIRHGHWKEDSWVMRLLAERDALAAQLAEAHRLAKQEADVYRRKVEELAEARGIARQYREALQFIERWELPRVRGRDGNLYCYESERGSNGARDYMRKVASDALHCPEEK